MTTRHAFENRRAVQGLSVALAFVVLACATDAVSGVDSLTPAPRSKPSSPLPQSNKGASQGKGMPFDEFRRELLRRLAESRPPTAVSRVPLPQVTTPRPVATDHAQSVQAPRGATTSPSNQATPSAVDFVSVERRGGEAELMRLLKSKIVDARKNRILRLLGSLSFEFAA